MARKRSIYLIFCLYFAAGMNKLLNYNTIIIRVYLSIYSND